MLVRDLLEKHDNRGGPGTINGTIELMSDDDSIEIDIEYNFDASAPEYEDGHLFYSGGFELNSAKVSPFTFEKKRYTKITPELVGNLDIPSKFEKKCPQKIKDYIKRGQDEAQKIH